MSFFKEVASALGIDKDSIANGYQIINYNGNAVYIEGFRRILSIDERAVAVALKKQRLTVSGENLAVKELENNTVIVCGKIISVSAEDL